MTAMNLIWAAAIVGLIANSASSTQQSKTTCEAIDDGLSIHNFTLSNLLETENVSLSTYSDKIVLIVNVATYCGYTLQYPLLNELKNNYSNGEFEILGIPCNHFMKQEPGGSGVEIWNGIKYVRPGNGFEPNFPLFKKLDVNGENEHPLYTYLKRSCPPTTEEFSSQTKLFYTPMRSRDIRWNFEKFLIDKRGKPIKRYAPSTQPMDIESDINILLSSKD